MPNISKAPGPILSSQMNERPGTRPIYYTQVFSYKKPRFKNVEKNIPLREILVNRKGKGQNRVEIS